MRKPHLGELARNLPPRKPEDKGSSFFHVGRKYYLTKGKRPGYSGRMSEAVPFDAGFDVMDKTEGTIRSVVVRLMESTGLTQREFSRRWGISEAMLSKLISGTQRDVSFEQARKLVAAFGLNPRVLFPDPDGGNGQA